MKDKQVKEGIDVSQCECYSVENNSCNDTLSGSCMKEKCQTFRLLKTIKVKEQECEQLRNKLNSNIERMNAQNEKLHNEIQVIRQLMKNILMVQTNGKYRPVKNSTKEQCYQVLGNIQELLKTNIIQLTERSNNATKNIHTKRESR